MSLCVLLHLGPRDVVNHLKVQTDATAIFTPGAHEAPLATSLTANSDRYCVHPKRGLTDTACRVDSQVVGDVGDFWKGCPAGHGGQ